MNITEKDLEGLTDMQKLFIKILLEMKRKDEIAFDLIGFDSEDIDTQIKMWVDSIEVSNGKNN